MADGKVALYSFCHSSCGWRVRLALDVKGIPWEYKVINLSRGDQLSPEFLKISPLQLVPVLEIDGVVLCDSIAILEIVNTIAANIEPLQNLRVVNAVKELKGPEAGLEWAQKWITRGFGALERILAKTSGKYCFGDEITLADIAFVPQMRNAKRYHVDEPIPVR